MIIDFHTHVFPDEIAQKTTARMADDAQAVVFSDGTQNGLLESMKRNNVDISVTQPVATKPEQVESINNWTISNRKDGIIPFGAIHPDYEQIERELVRIHADGIKGIKLHPDYQSFYPTEDRLIPIYKTCEKLGLIVLFHAGDDIGHPRPGHSLPRLLAQVADSFPRIKFVFAHMGGYEMWDQSEKYLVGKNVYLDTSYSLPYLTNDRMTRIILKHGPHRILLGSDSPWGNIENDITCIQNANLGKNNIAQILGKNAAELLGL